MTPSIVRLQREADKACADSLGKGWVRKGVTLDNPSGDNCVIQGETPVVESPEAKKK